MRWKIGLLSMAVLAMAWLGHAAESPLGPSFDAPPAAGNQNNQNAAAVQEKTATSRVTHVTIYPNSALVTRDVEVPEGAGAMELVVTPLPEQTMNSSLYSEGSDGIRVLSTRFRTRPVREDTREEVRKLEDQQRTLQREIQRIEADVKTNEANLQLLSKLENFTAATTHAATEKATLNAETIISLTKHVMDQRGEIAKQQVALEQKKQDQTEQMQFAQRKLQELTAGRSRTERDAVIVLEKANRASGKVRLNYLVNDALWRPQYKFRAGKDEKEAVQVEYLAAIVQQTGEDWSNVALTLSTAQPMLNAAPPDLRMLEVAVLPRGMVVADNNMNPGGQAPVPQVPGMGGGGRNSAGQFGQFGGQPNPQAVQQIQEQAKALRGRAAAEYNSRKEGAGSQLVNEAAALEQGNELLNYDDRQKDRGKQVARSEAREGPSVTYHLKTKHSIPSRNDEQVLEVTRLEMSPEYFYKAVPILSPHVYRLANLMNKSEYILLPGEATMYQGTDFVGRMNLPLVAIGEQYTVGFGADPQLQVHRQMIEKSQTMQGGNQVLHYEYRILLSSYKPQAVSLQLWDRLPLAENERTVYVSLIKNSPEISKDPIYEREEKPKNLLRWDLKVDPGMNGEKALTVNYDFKLELDKQMTISSVSTRVDNRTEPAPRPPAQPAPAGK